MGPKVRHKLRNKYINHLIKHKVKQQINKRVVTKSWSTNKLLTRNTYYDKISYPLASTGQRPVNCDHRINYYKTMTIEEKIIRMFGHQKRCPNRYERSQSGHCGHDFGNKQTNDYCFKQNNTSTTTQNNNIFDFSLNNDLNNNNKEKCQDLPFDSFLENISYKSKLFDNSFTESSVPMTSHPKSYSKLNDNNSMSMEYVMTTSDDQFYNNYNRVIVNAMDLYALERKKLAKKCQFFGEDILQMLCHYFSRLVVTNGSPLNKNWILNGITLRQENYSQFDNHLKLL
ncbi:uncharacterized protein LOC128961663 [Oppia nitens]|uniref:uncharacterized protein LOC128961663 n=1 Tax=Oppia nitens TaxID=1686743 RepID=UPI0023DC83AD|nr:uncharacterized protein LOC128961663 [Oppia nitens]